MKNVILKKITYEDTKNIVKWRNSFHVKKNLFSQEILSEETHNNWLKTQVETKKCYQYIIYLIHEHKAIGTVFIKKINYEKSEGEFGIFIGEESELGKGYGTQAAKLVLDIAFNEIQLNRIILKVIEDNNYGKYSYQKVGFKTYSISTKKHDVNDISYNILLMELFRKDWNKINVI